MTTSLSSTTSEGGQEQTIMLSTSSSTTAPALAFVTQNNRGLAFLKNGDVGQARKCFTDALRGAQLGLVQPPSSQQQGVQQEQQQEQQQEAVGSTNTTVNEQQQDQDSSHTTTATTATATTSTALIREQLFTRLRALPTTTDLQEQALSIFMDTTQLSSANMALIYAVIIYNMGLVYHVRGRDCQSSCALVKAVELYQKSLSIVMVELDPSPTASLGTTTPRNPIIDLLRMALLKHLADIHHCSILISSSSSSSSSSSPNAADMARMYGDELSNFIHSIGGCFTYRDPRVTELMQAQVGCFLMYAFSLNQGSLLAPAA